MNNSIIHEFPHIPASKSSLSRRKPVFGVGINDANYITKLKINGKLLTCPYYRAWKNMIQRCYSTSYKEINSTYNGCTVCSAWLIFSSFKSWMEKQDWKGNQLDKDITISGNKVYQPNSCIFVSALVNSILTDAGSIRGKYRIGVIYNKRTGFQARMSVNGKQQYLGCFESEDKAHKAFLIAKCEYVYLVAKKQVEPIKSSLIKISKLISQGHYY